MFQDSALLDFSVLDFSALDCSDWIKVYIVIEFAVFFSDCGGKCVIVIEMAFFSVTFLKR